MQAAEIVETSEKQGGFRKTRRSLKYGSRAKVYHGGAEMTSGGLRKDDLDKNKYGRIVSKKKSQTMKNRI